jgi:hypothetical protein
MIGKAAHMINLQGLVKKLTPVSQTAAESDALLCFDEERT